MAKQTNEKMYEVLGRGYDVFEFYASIDSVRRNILNLKKLNDRGEIQHITTTNTKVLKITSDSKESYIHKMSNETSAKLNIYGFSASLNLNFNTAKTSKTHNYFSTYSRIAGRHGFYLNSGLNLKDYVDDSVKRNLNDSNKSADDIFRDYGHYVVVGIQIGGRIDHNIIGSSSSSTALAEFESIAEVSFSSYGSIKNKHSDSKASTKDDLQTHLKIEVYGGRPSFGASSYTDAELKAWEKTVDEHAIFVDFLSTGGRALIPIWELVDTDARAKELMKRFNELNLKHGKSLNIDESIGFVTDIKFVSDPTESVARGKMPAGYKPVEGDLNKGTKERGDYIYMCKKMGTKDNAYTDFFLQYTDQKVSPTAFNSHAGNVADYQRISGDLNKGAKGDYIYMYATKSKTKAPIKEVKVIFGEKAIVEDGWEIVNWRNSENRADVNKGAKGSYIYIVYKR